MTFSEEKTIEFQENPQADKPEETPRKKKLKLFAWIGFGLFLLFFFTFLRFPKARIEISVQSMIASALEENGYQLVAESSELRFLPKPSYRMEGVSLTAIDGGAQASFERVHASPRLIPLLTGKAGANLILHAGGGVLQANIAANPSSFDIRLNGRAFPIEPLVALAGPLPLQFEGKMRVNGRLKGKIEDPTTLNGSLHLELHEVRLPGQLLLGMALPELRVSHGELITRIEEGKAEVGTLQLGDKSRDDDIAATGTGHLQLGQTARASQVDLTVSFELSEKVLGITPFLQTVLQSGRQDSGEYRFLFKGSLAGPLIPVPAP